MKKSLIALAVAGAFAAPAFAATENVDVYGKLHLSVSFVDDQITDQIDTTDNVSDLQFTSNASRFGLKGAEDLGGGLSAIWQVESGVNLDEGGGTLASRNSFVGLKGGFGTALIGKHDTPLKLVGRAVDLFGDTFADSRNVLGGGSDIRANNVVAYISPSFSGLTFAAAYTNDLTTGTTNDANLLVAGTQTDGADMDEAGAFNVNATYTNGPLYLGAAYGDGDGHERVGAGPQWRLAGGYTFGNFKVVGQYDSLESDLGDADYTAWMVGGAYTMGNIVLKANYMAGEVDNVVPALAFEPEQWAIGADYNLSKRTSLYALYVSAEDAISPLGGGAGSSDLIRSGNVDGDVSAFSFGMIHSF
jgi:predicted porin